MNILEIVLILVGLILILLSAIGVTGGRVSLLALGLFFAIGGFAIPVFTGA